MPDETKHLKPGDPYCSNCGYPLSNIGEASRCPECGRPIVEVLARHTVGGMSRRAVRIKSETFIFGYPVYHIAFGGRPEYGEAMGKARGLIAIGDNAVGGIAIGGSAVGVVAIGGAAVGVASLGGMSIGLLSALGGGSLGGIAVGGGAIGGIAVGGGAAGIVASGGGAIGVYARGGGAAGIYVSDFKRKDSEAIKMFETLKPIMGSANMGLSSLAQPAMAAGLVHLTLATVIGLVAVIALARGRKEELFETPPSVNRHARTHRTES